MVTGLSEDKNIRTKQVFKLSKEKMHKTPLCKLGTVGNATELHNVILKVDSLRSVGCAPSHIQEDANQVLRLRICAATFDEATKDGVLFPSM